MKERITYIHRADDAFEPSQLTVGKASLEIANLKAARDHRLTFSIAELPREIKSILSQFKQLHLRWTSAQQSISPSPFNSRLSPGLHIFLTPLNNTREDKGFLALKELFGDSIKRAVVKDAFTIRNHSNSKSPEAIFLKYHQNLDSLENVGMYIEKKLCVPNTVECKSRSRYIQTAESLDIDYDASSGELLVKAYQGRSSTPAVGWSTRESALENGRTEIGLLATQDATEKDHLKLGGYLVVLREEKKLKPTLFQFPSRHHPPPSLNSTYKISFAEPYGLHPTLQIKIDPSTLHRPRAADPDSCTLHAYLTLPSAIFPDKYQLGNELLLRSLNIRGVQSISGYTDLEAPDYAVSAWGSSMLVELEIPSNRTGIAGRPWQANVPLHLRYLPPSNADGGISAIQVPWPVVFWACIADDEISNLKGNPFDRTYLGYDIHFSKKTIFYHLQPESQDGLLVSSLAVPVLNTSLLGEDTRLLEFGTSLVVLAGWFWIVWLLFRGWWSTKSPFQRQKKTI